MTAWICSLLLKAIIIKAPSHHATMNRIIITTTIIFIINPISVIIIIICGRPGLNETASSPAMESQELNSRFLFTVHSLLGFSPFRCSLFSQFFCLHLFLYPSSTSTIYLKSESDYLQSFQPPYHFIVLPRAFHSIFFHLIVFFIEKNVFALVLKLKIAYSNTRTQAHSQAVVLLVVVLQVRRILFSNTCSKANYGLCAETGKTAAAMTNISGFTKSTELLTAVIFGRFAAVFFF